MSRAAVSLEEPTAVVGAGRSVGAERQQAALDRWLQRRDDHSLAEACEAWDPLPRSRARMLALKARGEIEDFAQEGRVGLIYAFRRFDPRRRRKFSTYATICVDGAIYHYLRDHHYPVRAPADLAKLSRAIARFEAGETLPDEVVAGHFGCSVEEVCEARAMWARVRTHPYPWQLNPDLWWKEPGDEGALMAEATERLMLVQAMEVLPDKLRTVVEERFYRGRTQREIGKIIGHTQMHAFRLERQATARMRQEVDG